MEKITVDELQQLIDSQQDIQLIDVRTPSEYLATKIASAKMLPLSHFDQLVPTLDRNQKVYTICASGNRATEFCTKIDQLGFNSVLIEGGMNAWEKKRYPVERGKNIPWSIERQMRFIAGLLIVIGFVLGMVVAPGFYYLSGFIGLGLVFSGMTGICGMAAILGKMPWNKKIIDSV